MCLVCASTVLCHKKHITQFFRRYLSKKIKKKFSSSQFWNRPDIRVLSQNGVGIFRCHEKLGNRNVRKLLVFTEVHFGPIRIESRVESYPNFWKVDVKRHRDHNPMALLRVTLRGQKKIQFVKISLFFPIKMVIGLLLKGKFSFSLSKIEFLSGMFGIARPLQTATMVPAYRTLSWP